MGKRPFSSSNMIADSNVQRNKSNNGRSNSDRLSHAIGNCILFVRTIFDYSVVILLCVCVFSLCMFDYFIEDIGVSFGDQNDILYGSVNRRRKKLLSCYLVLNSSSTSSVTRSRSLENFTFMAIERCCYLNLHVGSTIDMLGILVLLLLLIAYSGSIYPSIEHLIKKIIRKIESLLSERKEAKVKNEINPQHYFFRDFWLIARQGPFKKSGRLLLLVVFFRVFCHHLSWFSSRVGNLKQAKPFSG